MAERIRAALAPFLFLLLSSWLCPTALGVPLWFSNDLQLLQLAPDTQQVTPVQPLSGINAMAADTERDVVWVLSGGQLYRFEHGQLAASFPISAFGLTTAQLLQLDSHDGSIWLAGGLDAAHVDASGAMRARWTAPTGIQALALGLDQSLWVLQAGRLDRIDANGTLLTAQSLAGHFYNEVAERIVVDELGARLWLASRRQLLRYDLASLSKPLRSQYLAADIQAIALHPITGELWLATAQDLTRFDRSGATLSQATAAGLGLTTIGRVDFDAANDGFWLTGDQSLIKLASDGSIAARYALGSTAQRLGVAPFKLTPTLTLIHPPQNALTNNALPAFTLQYAAHCVGPCDLPASYYAGLNLSAQLNGQAVGQDFVFDASTLQSHYTPAARLPEGAHSFTASVIDRFGHRSDLLTNRFTVDTLAPVFTSLSPADGITTTAAILTIQGSVDDPTASVVLQNLGNWNGQGANPAIQNFRYTVTLNPGLNTFTLAAVDGAGNTTTKQVNISYAGSAIALAIASPSDGAAVAGDQVLVSGTYQGPANTGIIVNGVVAVTDGTRFYATVPLTPGANTLTVIATAPDGSSATRSVTVTSTAASPFSVSASPQEGVAPLQVNFEVGLMASLTAQGIDVDFDGNGTVDYSSSDPTAPIQFVYAAAGTYQAKFVITDASGMTVTQELPIVVKTPEQTDALFRDIWDGMNSSLSAGNKTQALRYLTESAQQKYGPAFDILMPNFADIVASYSPLQRVSVSSDLAEYAVNRTIDGEDRIFLIYFLHDSDGVWRLDAM